MTDLEQRRADERLRYDSEAFGLTATKLRGPRLMRGWWNLHDGDTLIAQGDYSHVREWLDRYTDTALHVRQSIPPTDAAFRSAVLAEMTR